MGYCVLGWLELSTSPWCYFIGLVGRRHVVRADLGDYFPVVVLTPAVDKNTKDIFYHRFINKLCFK